MLGSTIGESVACELLCALGSTCATEYVNPVLKQSTEGFERAFDGSCDLYDRPEVHMPAPTGYVIFKWKTDK